MKVKDMKMGEILYNRIPLFKGSLDSIHTVNKRIGGGLVLYNKTYETTTFIPWSEIESDPLLKEKTTDD